MYTLLDALFDLQNCFNRYVLWNKVCEFPEFQTAQLPNFTQTMRTFFLYQTFQLYQNFHWWDWNSSLLLWHQCSILSWGFFVYIRLVLGMPNRNLHKIAVWAMIVHSFWKTLPPRANFRPIFPFLWWKLIVIRFLGLFSLLLYFLWTHSHEESRNLPKNAKLSEKLE